MSDLKENVEQDFSDDSEDSEDDLVDAEIEQEELQHSLENQKIVENGEATLEASVELPPPVSVEPHPDTLVDPNTEDTVPANQSENVAQKEGFSDAKDKYENGKESENEENGLEETPEIPSKEKVSKELSKEGVAPEHYRDIMEVSNQSLPLVQRRSEGDESGTEEEQAAFMKELESFFRERNMEFKPPKFYGEGLNCLKLWRAVTRLGGYDRVTSCKLWRQVGESFKPPKTCTTVSWSFRCFYEKALLDYERHKVHSGELHLPVASFIDPMSVENQMGGNQSSGSGRARRDAAARAMQGWHSQRLLGNGEVGDPIIKDRNSISMPMREKQLKSYGVLKRRNPSNLDHAAKAGRTLPKAAKLQMDVMVVDSGPTADWVKINIKRTKDCFEVYALVPGLLREEVRVQSDPAGRLVISGEPEQPDNPWGVTAFKKVISLPSRIDPHQTSAVVTLHGQLFVRVPFEQS